MATTIKAGDSFELWSSSGTTAIVPVSDQKLTVIAYCSGSRGADVNADSAYASGGMGASESATITGISANMQLRCYQESAGVVWDSDESSGYPRGRGDGGKAARLELYNGVSYVPIFIAGGGGGGQLNRNATNSAWDISAGHDSDSGGSWQNPDGNGTTLTAGRSSVNTQGFEISFDWSDSGNVKGGRDGAVRVYVTSVLNYAPYITSFTSPATISTGNNIAVNWAGIQDTVNGTLTFDLDYTIDGGTTWTSLLASSTLTTYSLATPLISGSKTYQFRVRAKNSGYTGAYSYSTTILTGNLKPDDANSVALLHFDATQDETGKIMIPYGGAQISNTQSKFGGTALEITAPSKALLSSVATITGDFTVECFAYWKSSAGNLHARAFTTNRNSGNRTEFFAMIALDRNSAVLGTEGLYANTNMGAVTLDAWHHLAISRSSGTIKFFLDGSVIATASNTNSLDITSLLLGNASSAGNGTDYMNGYLDEFRVSNVARYTSAFTPPTSASTPDANTIFLSHFDKPLSTGLEDMCGNTWTASGSPTISTVATKFGSSSLLLPSGSVIIAPYSSAFAFPADFTIECFIYPTAYASSYGSNIFTRCWSGTNFIQLWMDTSGKIRTALSSTELSNTVGTVATLNNWHHVALVRSGSTVYLFLDGIVQGTMSLSTDLTNSNTQAVCIGGYSHATSQMPFIGAIDEFRISKGKARYTANFTPPSMPFGSSLQGFYRYII